MSFKSSDRYMYKVIDGFCRFHRFVERVERTSGNEIDVHKASINLLSMKMAPGKFSRTTHAWNNKVDGDCHFHMHGLRYFYVAARNIKGSRQSCWTNKYLGETY
jgi:hypothetical protein